jgi:hypothetical protein
MAFVYEGSYEYTESELNLFSIPTPQSREQNVRRFSPLSSITGGAPIEFDVTATGGEYLDMANSLLHVRAKI